MDNGFKFPAKGIIQAPVLIAYAAWVFPKLRTSWELDSEGKEMLKPYKFVKVVGPCLARNLIAYGEYVFTALQPDADRSPYHWPRRVGLIHVRHLRHFAAHIDQVLKRRDQRL